MRNDLKSILVIMPSWVGDFCMATPSLRHLRANCPSAMIVAFGRPQLAPLAHGLASIDTFVGGAMRGPSGLREILALRARRFDAALVLPNSFRSALAARLTGARERAGTARDGRSWLLTTAISDPKGLRTAAAVYGRIVGEWLGTGSASGPPELTVTGQEREDAAKMLRSGPGAPPRRDWILINPGAIRTDKRWAPAQFARAALALAESGLDGLARERIAVTGSPSEAPLCAEVARACNALDLCAGGITLATLKGVLERTRLLITNDTGPSHMAAALATPCLTLFGPTDHRWTPSDYPLERRLIAEPFLIESECADDRKTLCAIDRITAADASHAGIALVMRTSARG